MSAFLRNQWTVSSGTRKHPFNQIPTGVSGGALLACPRRVRSNPLEAFWRRLGSPVAPGRNNAQATSCQAEGNAWSNGTIPISRAIPRMDLAIRDGR
jgi:hypothetical protein